MRLLSFASVALTLACAHAPLPDSDSGMDDGLREVAFRALLAQPEARGEEAGGASTLRCLGVYRNGAGVDVAEELLRRLEEPHLRLRPLSACRRGPGWISTFRSAREYLLLQWSSIDSSHASVTAGYAVGDEYPEEHSFHFFLERTSSGWHVTSTQKERPACL